MKRMHLHVSDAEPRRVDPVLRNPVRRGPFGRQGRLREMDAGRPAREFRRLLPVAGRRASIMSAFRSRARPNLASWPAGSRRRARKPSIRRRRRVATPDPTSPGSAILPASAGRPFTPSAKPRHTGRTRLSRRLKHRSAATTQAKSNLRRSRLLLSRPMQTPSAVSALSALAHPGRLEIFRLLVRAGHDGMAAGEIARATGSLANTLSTNLNVLAERRLLVASRRDGRSIIYSAAYGQMRELLAFLMEDLLRRQARDRRAAGDHRRAGGLRRRRVRLRRHGMSDPAAPLNVLFLCTGNSARSIIAEGDHEPRRGWSLPGPTSAGSHPRGEVNPHAAFACSTGCTTQRTDCDRSPGTSSKIPTRRNSISCSRSATMPRRRCARCGPATP